MKSNLREIEETSKGINPLVLLKEFEEKSKGIGADLAGTAGG